MSLQELDDKGRRLYLKIWYPELPPTSNKLYFKGTRLTSPARDYRERFKMYVVQNYLHMFGEMPQPNELYTDPETRNLAPLQTVEPNLVFGLNLVFYMNLLTSWGDESMYKSRRARFRFTKVDLTNRIKFLEDCFKYSMDIDDSLTFASSQRKLHSTEHEGVAIEYYVLPIESTGIPRVPGGTM